MEPLYDCSVDGGDTYFRIGGNGIGMLLMVLRSSALSC